MSAPVSTLRLSYRPPYDWASMLAWLSARAIAGVEKVDGDTYARTFRDGESSGIVQVSHDAAAHCLVAEVRFLSRSAPAAVVPAAVLASVEERLRRVLGLDSDIPAAVAHLSGDPALAPRLAALPGLRIPGGWDAFELAIRAILGQQITVKAARLLAGRLTASFGEQLSPEVGLGESLSPEVGTSPDVGDLTHTFPAPDRLAALDPTALGMPRARAEALRSLAGAAASNPALFQRGATLEDTIARLRALRGIGDWTAHYIALRGLREPDAFPASDIGLLRGAEILLGQRPSPPALLAHAERWRPFRACAAQHLWALDAEPRPRG